MTELTMELRGVEESERLIVGVVAPYDETTYLVADPAGERIRRGAFAKTIRERGDRIPLLVAHERGRKLGTSRAFREESDGLVGEFVVNPGPDGDRLLVEARDGYYGGLSAGFKPLGQPRRGADGAREVVEAALVEVSMIGVPAYAGAGLLEVREAQTVVDVEALLAPFANPPAVNLSPLPPAVYRSR